MTNGQVVEAVVADNATTFMSAVNQVSTIVVPDTLFLGGLIQIVDAVLVPPFGYLQTASEAPLPYFVSILSQTLLYGGFEQIVQNVTAEPNTTYFAVNTPQDASSSVQMTKQQTIQYIEYSVIPGLVVYSTDMTNGSTFRTQQGNNLTITVIGNDTYINSAKITRKDLLIANGVLQVIDSSVEPAHLPACSTDNSQSSQL